MPSFDPNTAVAGATAVAAAPRPSGPAPIPFVDLKAQYRQIRTAVRAALDEVCSNADFVLGKELDAFEREFAAFTGAKYAVGVNSGTGALVLAMRAAGIGKGDEVIAPANTFISSVIAISHAGAKPVLVDVDPVTYTIDPAAAEKKITKRTKAILPVHLFGQTADMDPIQKLARKHKLIVIEDACQAHGATYKGRNAGTLGDLAAFSFYPGKNLGSYGEGGAVTTNSEKYSRAVREMRNIGQSAKNVHTWIGYNERLHTLQAAVLRVKLPHLAAWTEKRRKAAALYTRGLRGLPVVPPMEAAGRTHVYHLYVIRAPKRDALGEFLRTQGIGTGVHYPTPVHLQPCYADLKMKPGACPESERAAREILSLPIFPEITPAQVRRVCDTIREFYTRVG
jgi:dTDP-4-amino-4,6-dideoxygalactose transaminase